ncbi:hypothetical protein GCM10011514_52350 [Emticicia aquatilis]|uniref:Uncharacterized protein n=1 Tax=Emticicia aquatilis TaxID=1537369 RepID=A0A916Z8Q3_9BACT|nr:hypothetical protein [Emticicia aquatilis]GGD81809.1 hypothetical protein GCM10011514_52350 [Emticicia aquatilis]
MTEQEKYEKWKKIAEKMLNEKQIIQEVGVELAQKEYGIEFNELRPPRIREKK